MAAKFWFVTGNGSANWAVAANWYTSSAHTTPAGAAPTSADDVFLDVASGGGTLTIAAAAVCGSINMTGFTGTLAGASNLSITTTVPPPSDNVMILGGNITYTGALSFNGAYNATTLKITSNGRSLGGAVTFNALDVNFSTQDTFTCVGTLTVSAGNINTGDFSKDFVCNNFSSSNTNTRRFYCNNLYMTGNGSLIFLTTLTNADIRINNIRIEANQSIARTLTIPASYTLHINIYYGGIGTGILNLAVGTAIYPNLFITNQGGQLNVSAASRFASIEFLAGNSCNWNNTGTFGVGIDDPLGITSSIVGIYMDPLTPVPILTPTLSMGSSGTTPITLNTNAVPFNTNPITNSGVNTLTVLSKFVSTNQFSVGQGEVVAQADITVNTFSFPSTGIFSFNANGLTITAANAFTVSGIVNFKTPGIINTVITAPGITFNASATGTIINNTLLLITGSGSAFSLIPPNVINFSSDSTIKFTDTTANALTFAGAARTFGNVIFDRGTSTGSITVTGNNSFNTFEDRGTAAHSILIGAGNTQTISNFKVRGNPGALISIDSTTTATHALISASVNGIPPIQSVDYLNIQHSIASGNNVVWFAGTHSIDNQGVASTGSGWTFTTPTSAKFSALGVG